jgi:drug/metabolite transporter (DMT)-like permease
MNAPKKQLKTKADLIKPPDDRKSSLDLQAIVLITGCCLIWGYQQIAIQAIADEVPLLMQLTIRSIIATVCVWVWMMFKGVRPFQADRTFIPGVIAGLLFFAEFVLLYSALEYTNTSRAITFLYLAPFIVALVLPIFIPAERLNMMQSSGLLIAFAGLAFAFHDGFSSGAAHFLLGDIAVIGAAAAWALTTIVVRTTTLGQIQPERTLFFQLFFSSIGLISLCFVVEIPLPETLSINAMASLFLQSVIIAAASYLFWFWLLRHYLASKVSAFSFLTPMFGLLFGFFLAGDPINSSLIAAFSSIVLGIYLVNRRQGNSI